MRLGFAGSLVAAALFGVVSIGLIWWRPTGLSRNRLLVSSLAVGIGLGLSSCAFFLWLSLVGAPSAMFPIAESGLIALLAVGTLYAGMARRVQSAPPAVCPPALRQHPLLALALWLSLGCATMAFLAQSVSNPQGGWDAWMTWNMHARAIFRGGDQWREVLTGLPDWSHPDYPLLVPASVARIWTYAGHETTLAPAAVGMLFTFAAVGLLYSSVALLRSRTQGALAALLLLGTKFFILHGASQYADIPLGFFFLATLALLALLEAWPDNRPRILALAGVTAGLSTWTKNEGLLFVLAVLVGYGLVVVRARGWQAGLVDARAFVIGLAPVFAILVCFKVWLAPANDLMSDQGLGQAAERLLDGTRYLHVLGGFKQAFLEIGAQGVVGVLLLTYLLFAGLAPPGPARLGAKAAAIVVALMLAGYAAVLLTAPGPLLGTNIRSINRLLLQLWPTALLAYFLSVRTPEEAGALAQRVSHV